MLEADEERLLAVRKTDLDCLQELRCALGADPIVGEVQLAKLRPLNQRRQGCHAVVAERVLVQLHDLQSWTREGKLHDLPRARRPDLVAREVQQAEAPLALVLQVVAQLLIV